MSIEMTLTGVDAVVRSLAPEDLLGPPVRDFFDASTKQLEGAIKRNMPGGLRGGVNTGGLRASFTSEVGPGVIPLYAAVGTPLKIGPYVEDGTVPHMPPVAPIAAWVQQKGLAVGAGKTAGERRASRRRLGKPTDAAMSVAWAIALTIKRKGTRGVHMVRTAFESEQASIQARWEQTGEAIAARFRGGA